MKNAVLFVALAFASSAALAARCPKDMKAIDAALPKANLSSAQMGEVKKLRAEGEAQHKAGRHAESVATLKKAEAILGLN